MLLSPHIDIDVQSSPVFLTVDLYAGTVSAASPLVPAPSRYGILILQKSVKPATISYYPHFIRVGNRVGQGHRPEDGADKKPLYDMRGAQLFPVTALPVLTEPKMYCILWMGLYAGMSNDVHDWLDNLH